MAGGLNDLELETLEEVNLSPPLAARPPPAVPARRARRIVSGVALGVTLTLALITWVSLRVEVEMEEPIQAPTPREQEDEPIQAPTPREPEDAEPEIVTPAITRRRLRGGGGASWWARLLRRPAEATY